MRESTHAAVRGCAWRPAGRALRVAGGGAIVVAATAVVVGCGVYGVREFLHFEPEVRAPGRWTAEREPPAGPNDSAALRIEDAGLRIRIRAPDRVDTGGEAWVLVNAFPLVGGSAEYPTHRSAWLIDLYCGAGRTCEVAPQRVKADAEGIAALGYSDAGSLSEAGRAMIAPDAWNTLRYDLTVGATVEAFDLVFGDALIVDGAALTVPAIRVKIRRVPQPFFRGPGG